MRQQGLAQYLRSSVVGCLLGAVFLGAPQSAEAQSGFACRNLETHSAMPAVEGKDGVFFRIDPDLHAFKAMNEHTIGHIAQLSEALKARGTTLVLLPVPGRAQVLAHQLPTMARHLGYQAETATAVHLDMIEHLERAGIAVADPRQPLRQAALAGETVFFKTDPRATSAGTRIMAKTVADVLAAHPDTKDKPRQVFKTYKGDEATLHGAMRAQLQLGCQDPLPLVKTQAYLTSAFQDDGAGQPVATSGRVAVIGTEFVGTAVLNFSGFLSEFSGLSAISYGVTGGGAYAAMSSYLTSADFSAVPPDVLVWEIPVWEPTGNQGDQPIKELIAAASQSCTTVLPLRTGSATNRVVADLGGLSKTGDIALVVETGGTPSPLVRFHFTSQDSLVRTRSIYRHPDQILTGRFYLPLSGLDVTTMTSVEIELPLAFGPGPSLKACNL